MKTTTIRLLILVFACMGSNVMMAQNRIAVTGTVKDSVGNGIAGITFIVKGTKIAGATDEQGNFKVNVPSERSVLVFTGIGFMNEEVPIAGNNFLSVILHSNSKSLSEVIVTGFGVKKDVRKLSYSATEVKGEDLVRANNANVVNALQGKVAGVQISPGAGGPSSSASIRIRGNARLDG